LLDLDLQGDFSMNTNKLFVAAVLAIAIEERVG